MDIPVFVVIEAIAMLCLICRMSWRWRTSTKWAVDDWMVLLMTLVWLAFIGIGQYRKQAPRRLMVLLDSF